MSARDELGLACQWESTSAMLVHDQAHAYAAGDITAEELLEAALQYGQARLGREQLQDRVWGTLS